MGATWFPGITPSSETPAEIDTSVAHPARVYDYILGGKNNFAADQAAARAALTANPAHARALLASSADGSCAYVQADLRAPDAIMADPLLQETLNMAKPVALVLAGILHFIPDSDRPHDIVARLVAALAPGSYLAIQHPTADFYPPGAGTAAAYQRAGIAFQYRIREEFARFFTGLELVPPGIVPMAEWRAETEPAPRPAPSEASAYAAVARKN